MTFGSASLRRSTDERPNYGYGGIRLFAQVCRTGGRAGPADATTATVAAISLARRARWVSESALALASLRRRAYVGALQGANCALVARLAVHGSLLDSLHCPLFLPLHPHVPRDQLRRLQLRRQMRTHRCGFVKIHERPRRGSCCWPSSQGNRPASRARARASDEARSWPAIKPETDQLAPAPEKPAADRERRTRARREPAPPCAGCDRRRSTVSRICSLGSRRRAPSSGPVPLRRAAATRADAKAGSGRASRYPASAASHTCEIAGSSLSPVRARDSVWRAIDRRRVRERPTSRQWPSLAAGGQPERRVDHDRLT
jgi:hypothetical protein